MLESEPDELELSRQRSSSKARTGSPLISIVMPVFQTPLPILTDSLLSVLTQTYNHWELCIANASPERHELNSLLQDFVKKDNRIRIVNLTTNEGISINTNQGIALASGEYIAFLDHDDLLAPFALFEVSQLIANTSQVDVIYSDEDRITSDKQSRYDPCFRPDFSPDILRSNNYMPHLLVIRREFGEKVGWLKDGYEAAQDHEFILRATENTKFVFHIPKVLYHWRAISGSTALSDKAKPYSHLSGTRAIEDHIWRIGRYGKVVDGHGPNYHKATFCTYPYKKVSILVLHKDENPASISRCINSIIQNTSYPNFEIIVGSPQSKKGLLSRVRECGNDVITTVDVTLNTGDSHFAALNTLSKSANGEILLFLDEESEIVNRDWLTRMVEHGIWPENGVVGGMMLHTDKNTIYNAGYLVGGAFGVTPIYRNFPEDWPGYFGMLKHQRNITAVSIECMMVRMDLFERVQGFDPSFIKSFGDIDFCIRISQEKYRNIWTPYTKIKLPYIDEQPLLNKEVVDADLIYFQNKHREVIANGDPFYSRNLSPDTVEYGDKMTSGNFTAISI